MRRVAAALTMAIMCALLAPTFAATITVGTHDLLPDTPNQKIPIYVSAEPGDPSVAGVNFNVQVADGGPEAGGTVDGPEIPYVQLVDDPMTPGYSQYHTTVFGPTLFDQKANQGHFGVGPAVPQVYIENTAFLSGGAVADGLLAVVTVDTTGFFLGDGPWELKVGNTLNGPTDLLEDSPMAEPIPLNVTEGQIVIIPEPSTLFLLLIGALGFGFWWRNR